VCSWRAAGCRSGCCVLHPPLCPQPRRTRQPASAPRPRRARWIVTERPRRPRQERLRPPPPWCPHRQARALGIRRRPPDNPGASRCQPPGPHRLAPSRPQDREARGPRSVRWAPPRAGLRPAFQPSPHERSPTPRRRGRDRPDRSSPHRPPGRSPGREPAVRDMRSSRLPHCLPAPGASRRDGEDDVEHTSRMSRQTAWSTSAGEGTRGNSSTGSPRRASPQRAVRATKERCSCRHPIPASVRRPDLSRPH
jgi:hypothetical protein